MVYPVLKIFVRLALKIFCAEINVLNPRALETEGPLLITANHPNSFFDAIIIGASLKEPVHFLARGDAFKKPWHNALLSMLNMIPIYRLSEGKENLHLNEKTFQRSQQILSKGGIVLIFIEGLCVQEYGLRPFKKGAARIALNCHSENIPLKILPLGINYSSFTETGMYVEVHPGKELHPAEVFTAKDTAGHLLAFNNSVHEQLKTLVWTENEHRKPKKNYWLIPFAFIGTIVNAPFYYPLKKFVADKTKGTVFYHAVMFGVLLLTYPFYLAGIGAVLIALGINYFAALSVFILFPMLGYAAVQKGTTF